MLYQDQDQEQTGSRPSVRRPNDLLAAIRYTRSGALTVAGALGILGAALVINSPEGGPVYEAGLAAGCCAMIMISRAAGLAGQAVQAEMVIGLRHEITTQRADIGSQRAEISTLHAEVAGLRKDLAAAGGQMVEALDHLTQAEADVAEHLADDLARRRNTGRN